VRPAAPASDAALAAAINRPLVGSVRTHYDALAAKRNAGSLTAPEYDELQRLTDGMEADHLLRWENIARIAALRGDAAASVATRFGLVLPA